MNICMFTNTYLPHVGGVARSVSTFAEDLRQLGENVLIVAPTFEGMQDDENKQQVLRIAAIQNFNGSDFSVRIPLPGIIEEKINDFAPDIIHSHHPFLLGDAALRTARHLEIPIVFTHHTLYEQYTHYVPLDSDAMKRFVIQLATEYANLCNCVIAPSSSIRELLRERGVKQRLEVLPTGIDLNYFRQGDAKAFRRRHNIPEECMVVGHLGRLAWEKNLPYLAGAVRRFMEKRDKVVFLVAGTGDAEDEIRRIFGDGALEDRLFMPGILEGTDLADCYRAMDVFVFASQSETQGLVLMEALAAEVPVIALRASGVSDVVEEGVNGRILPADMSQESFAAAIDSAFSSGELEQWQKSTFETARQFSRKRCAEKLLDLYRAMLAENVRPSKESDMLHNLRQKLKTEWELLQEKAAALKQGLTES